MSWAIRMPKPLNLAFDTPFHEAINAAQKRHVVLPDTYYGELQGLARQHAFSIAGITALDQLEQVRDSLATGLQRGVSFNKWKKEILQNGVLDLPAHRLDNIFRTNIQNNYNRGRWEKLQSTVNARPYLMYDAINDSRVRPAHAAMDGIIRRADDSFWDAHTPSNGFRSILPEQRVSGNVLLGLKAFYSGQAVEIITSDGSSISVTAQHPILTSGGWVASDKIKQGNKLISYVGEIRTCSTSGEMDINNTPPTIKQVFDSLSGHIRATLPRTLVNLYGDIEFIKGDVDVVGVDRSLMANLKSEIREFTNNFQLPKSDTRKIFSSCFRPLLSFFPSSSFERLGRCFRLPCQSFFGRIKLLSFCFRVNNNPVLLKKFCNTLSANMMFFCKPVNCSPVGVFANYEIGDRFMKFWSFPTFKFNASQGVLFFFCPKYTVFFKIFSQRIMAYIAKCRTIFNASARQVEVEDMFWDWLSSFRSRISKTSFTSIRFGTLDASITDDYIGDPITNPDAFNTITNRHAGLVKTNDVVYVRFFNYHGYVYDLETKSGTILAYGGVKDNHFVLSNCRCRVISLSEKQAQRRSGGNNGLNKAISKSKMKPDKGWDYNPGADLTKGIEKAVAQRENKGSAIMRTSLRNKLSGLSMRDTKIAPYRMDWSEDFPKVILNGPLGDAARHPQYNAAKNGNLDASLALAYDLVTPELIAKIRAIAKGEKPLLIPVHAEEQISINRIPLGYAIVIADKLGLAVDMNIVQSAKVGRTGANGFSRLAFPPPFSGVPDKKARHAIILDDTLTQGGTLANLRGYIGQYGINTLAATTLTGKNYSSTLAITRDTLNAIRSKYNELEHWWVGYFGYGFSALTESEARYILKSGQDANSIRNKIITERQTRLLRSNG